MTPERAKANYYARLKVEHGWQRQNLNEVENLYFRHTHMHRPPPIIPAGGRRTAGSSSVSASSTSNILFPVNEPRPNPSAHAILPDHQFTGVAGQGTEPPPQLPLQTSAPVSQLHAQPSTAGATQNGGAPAGSGSYGHSMAYAQSVAASSTPVSSAAAFQVAAPPPFGYPPQSFAYAHPPHAPSDMPPTNPYSPPLTVPPNGPNSGHAISPHLPEPSQQPQQSPHAQQGQRRRRRQPQAPGQHPQFRPIAPATTRPQGSPAPAPAPAPPSPAPASAMPTFPPTQGSGMTYDTFWSSHSSLSAQTFRNVILNSAALFAPPPQGEQMQPQGMGEPTDSQLGSAYPNPAMHSDALNLNGMTWPS
ncbi:hypothetical protein IEO21_04247 [Rhodonia placenta]|uniref:Uncharacterized protein n=1 Tax=Rhodonia placenta TaxID=104341 RepID=A0A8H7U2Q5_9APHY|nr:hypothetical protein IEO21_04247 [Postia placenta]